MSKLMHNVRAYNVLIFGGFLSVAYTTLNKLLEVFFINQSIPHRPFLIGRPLAPRLYLLPFSRY